MDTLTPAHAESPLPTSQLDWQNGQPVSILYDDIYFSTDSGLAETGYVFLAQNRLAERWQALNNATQLFTIAETGFGTGLNFLCTWQHWLAHAPAEAALHFISLEKHPLTAVEMAKALQLWPTLMPMSGQLLAQYRWLTPGFHRFCFADGRVTLSLLIGDVNTLLPQLEARVDAWFLDGFAPAKNPAMWQQNLFADMAKLSHTGTTFATFTSAGMVKRGLQSAGFHVEKCAGYGRKREMLRGQMSHGKIQDDAINPTAVSPPPQIATVASTDISCQKMPEAIVIGAGISGTASAHALARRGYRVTLIERHAQVAQEASGNQVGVIYPRLAGQDIALGRLALEGYLHSLRLFQQPALAAADYQPCGLLQLAFDQRELARCRAIAARQLPQDVVRYVEQDQATDIAGIHLAHAGLYFPQAGYLHPPALCQALAAHENITLMASSEALCLAQHRNGWQVMGVQPDGKQSLLAEAAIVILASANDTAVFSQTAHLPLSPVRGQVSQMAVNSTSQTLRIVLCSDGYISPAFNGQHAIGATFSPNDTAHDIRAEDHQANLSMLKRMSTTLYQQLSQQQPISGRVAMRCTTPDYLPVAGPVLDAAALAARLPRHTADPANLPWLRGLYVNSGHGSKGLITAPLCAEAIAAAINGEPLLVGRPLLAALDVNRFLLRKLGLKRLVSGLASQGAAMFPST